MSCQCKLLAEKDDFIPIIGVEVHVELATRSKMFCECPANHFGKEPNTQTCPVCLGLPGSLPVPNEKAIEWTVMLAKALNCQINTESHFDRKNYFYPDLPKGYQITQYDMPFGHDGWLLVESQGFTECQVMPARKKIRIRRVHLEEDTGKLQHQSGIVAIDFNRSGVPLVEIVTEPDFRSIEEVDSYLKKLRQIIRYLGISNADMEKGSMRLEPSISLARASNCGGKNNNSISLPSYRVELKNINSFRFVRQALEYEIKRQKSFLLEGKELKQETRGYDSVKGITFPQRYKEEAHDYRYFPEPDIPPVVIDQYRLSEWLAKIPELPDDKLLRFQENYGLSSYQAKILTEDRELANYYELCLKGYKIKLGTEASLEVCGTIANWIINKRINWREEDPQQVIEKLVSSHRAKENSDKEKLQALVEQVLQENAKAVADFKSGKTNALSFLIGQAAKKVSVTDRKLLRDLLERRLKGDC